MLRFWMLALCSALMIISCFAESPPIGKLFVAVADKKVLGKFPILSEAKKALKVFPDGATVPIRMIAEANDGKVNNDPRTVGGEDQASGLVNGFNIWWNTWSDIQIMSCIT